MTNQEFINFLITKASFTKKHYKGEIIFQENDECQYVCIVLSGKVLVSSYTFNGKEIIFKKLEDGAMFGHLLIFASNNLYRGFIEASSNTTLAYIDKNSFYNIISHEPYLAKYLSLLSDDILISKEMTRVLSFDKTSDRLLYLLSIHKTFKFDSISSLAKELSISRESLSRTLKNLEKQGLIVIHNKTIYYQK